MRTVKMPAALVTVGTAQGPVELKCAEIDVPLDSDGEPFSVRVSVDSHNNLRVLESTEAFMLFHADAWVSVSAEHRTVLEAVKNAS